MFAAAVEPEAGWHGHRFLWVAMSTGRMLARVIHRLEQACVPSEDMATQSGGHATQPRLRLAQAVSAAYHGVFEWMISGYASWRRPGSDFATTACARPRCR